jgi:N-acetylglucosaminyl-diphospho-decaprenol L-rhamnosyltransferase
MTSGVHVSICIVAFRNTKDIVGCLEALGRSTYADFEVVICENGGESAYRALVDVLTPNLPTGQPVQIISAPENPGYAGGVNIAMRASPDVDAWWVLNPDTAPHEAALARLVERLQVGNCQAVGSTVHSASGVIQNRGGNWNAWLARAVSLEQGLSIEGGRPVAELEARMNYLSGASMIVSREFLERVGPMREDYFLYAEEVEWCVRAQQLGCRLGMAIDARIPHQQGSSTGSVSRIVDRHHMPVYLDERNKMLLTRDRFPLRLPVAAVSAFLLLFLRFGRRGAWKQLAYGISGWMAGLLNRRGKPPWLEA